MNEELRRKLALDTYGILVAQLDERGILIDSFTSEQLTSMTTHDVESLNKRFQSLLRNPVPRGT